MVLRRCVMLAAAMLVVGCAGSFGANPGSQRIGSSILHAGGSSPIQHIVIIIQENRTFDNLFHGFPGANTVNTGKGHGTTYTLQPITLKWPYDLNHDHSQFLEDYDQGKVDGTERILAEMTIRAGHIVFDLNARAAVPWREGHLKYATR